MEEEAKRSFAILQKSKSGFASELCQEILLARCSILHCKARLGVFVCLAFCIGCGTGDGVIEGIILMRVIMW